MKKVITSIILAAALIATLASCVSRKDNDEKETKSEEEILAELQQKIEEMNNPSTTSRVAKVKYAVYKEYAEVVGCDSPVGEVVIDATVDGVPVTKISENAFEGLVTITSVMIPDSVVTIGEKAFLSCNMLSSVTMPDSIREIGRYAFYGCSSLKEINIGKNVESIGFHSFASCASLEKITVDPANKNYCDMDGVLCSSDKTALYVYPMNKPDVSYTVPATVTDISDFAFAYASNLEKINAENVKNLGDYTFTSCTKLNDVKLGNKLTFIGAGTFQECTALTTFTVPDGVKSIGYTAGDADYGLSFYGCTELQKVELPASLEKITNGSFDKCPALIAVVFGGTSAQWKNVEIGKMNDSIDKATLITK